MLWGGGGGGWGGEWALRSERKEKDAASRFLLVTLLVCSMRVPTRQVIDRHNESKEEMWKEYART